MSAERLHFEVHGQEAQGQDKPYVLLVHGMLSSRVQWTRNLPALTPSYRCVVIELWGHGRSPTPHDPTLYSPASYAAQFEAIRAEVGADCWYVVGQSLGAALTLGYVLERPQSVIAQVFTNSNSALAVPGWTTRAREYLEKQAAVFRRDGSDAIRRHRLNPTTAKWLDDDLRAAFESDIALHDPEGLALTGLHTSLGSSVYERASQTAVPTLLVVGEREERFAASRAYAERTFPDLRTVPTEAGHAPNLATPDAFNAAVLAFFADHPPA